MTSRIGLLITALLLCHLIAAPPVVTSQLPPSAGGASPSGDEVTIEAQQQEKVGDLYRLRGDVVIHFRGYILSADELTYNAATGEATGSGHMVFDGGPNDEHLEAGHATYNVRTDSGKFYDVNGTTGARFRGKHVVLTSSNPFFFTGDEVDKVGPAHFVVLHGRVTTCELPHPKWTFQAEKVVVDIGDEAKLYHSTFRLFGIPIFYFPYVQHPVERLGRQSGFLIPSLGQSSRKGTILGESVYWAINRSADATIGAEYFSTRGWAQHLDFRARPAQNSFFNVRYSGVLDRGFGNPKVDQGGEEVRATGQEILGPHTRAVVDIDYLSSFVYRLAFSETFTQAVDSEARSNAFLSQESNGFFFNLLASRYQNFQSIQRGDVITILRAPSLDASTVERQAGNSRLFWSFDAAAQGVSRRQPGFVTGTLDGRFDVAPRVALPLLFGGWSVRPEVSVRNTYYTERQTTPLNGPGVPIPQAINRHDMEGSLELRPPALSRIFDRPLFGHRLKHSIEPRVTYRYVGGIDNFPNILRFDWRDIASDTNEVEYALVNRLFAKSDRPEQECGAAPDEEEESTFQPQAAPSLERSLAKSGMPGCRAAPAGARQIVSWEVAQKYFLDDTFGGALVNGRRNVFTTTADFSGIAFLTDPRRFSPLVSRLRVNTGHRVDVDWELDYDTKKGHIQSSTALVNWKLGDFFVAGSHAYLQVPGEIFVSTPIAGPDVFNQFRWLAGYGNPNKRGVNAAANIGFDVNSRFLQYSAFQTSYNWDCCGLSFEYRRFALGAVRNENQFRFALSLANVGTFGTLRRQERLF